MRYEYEGMQIEIERIADGKYFVKIYVQDHPDPLYCTSYYPTEEQAVEAAKEEIEIHQTMNSD